LAGGLSRRMGRDKAGLRLGSRTLLGHIRAEAGKLELPVRVIRHDRIPGCGPLGGIYSALKTSRAKAELFLACDMPFVTAGLMQNLLGSWETCQCAVFTFHGRVAGFPFVVPVEAWPMVERQIVRKQFSLQKLARALGATLVQSSADPDWELFNVNTPGDWQAARQYWTARKKRT